MVDDVLESSGNWTVSGRASEFQNQSGGQPQSRAEYLSPSLPSLSFLGAKPWCRCQTARARNACDRRFVPRKRKQGRGQQSAGLGQQLASSLVYTTIDEGNGISLLQHLWQHALSWALRPWLECLVPLPHLACPGHKDTDCHAGDLRHSPPPESGSAARIVAWVIGQLSSLWSWRMVEAGTTRAERHESRAGQGIHQELPMVLSSHWCRFCFSFDIQNLPAVSGQRSCPAPAWAILPAITGLTLAGPWLAPPQVGDMQL